MTTNPTRLSDEQIRRTIAAMRMSDEHKAVLLRQALAGDPGARFSVMGAFRRQNGTR